MGTKYMRVDDKSAHFISVDMIINNIEQLEKVNKFSTNELLELLKRTKEFGYDLANNKIYEFLYNSSIHESSSATMSIHRTRAGAEKAMEDHKAIEKVKWQKMYDSMKEKGEEEFLGILKNGRL